MEFSIRLNQPQGGNAVVLDAHSIFSGEATQTVPLPFDDAEISVLARALDLNDSAGVERWFSAKDAARLAEWGVLIGEPPQADITLTGAQLHRETLRVMVREKLYACLIAPFTQLLRSDLAQLRGRQRDEVLHLRLELWWDQVALFQYPWELLHGDRSLDGEIHISRYIRYPGHVECITATRHLRLLVLHSEPSNLPTLGLDDNSRISAGLKAAEFGKHIDTEFVDQVSPAALGDSLAQHRQQATIVHFAGHGDFGRRCEQCGELTTTIDGSDCSCGHPFPSAMTPCGYLALTDKDSGRVHWISAEEMRQTLAASKVQLVVLNACKTALARRDGDVFNGIAQCLMASIPAVVASPYPLDNQAALEFARCFYQELGNGHSLVDVLGHVRARMRASFANEWYRPVLYLRADHSDGGRLLDYEPITEQPRHATGVAATTKIPPEEVIFTLDFSSQQEQILQQVEAHRGRDEHNRPNPDRQRPMVFVIPGHTDYTTAGGLMDRLVGRLAAIPAACDDAAIGGYIDLQLDGSERQGSQDGNAPSLETRLFSQLRTQLFAQQRDIDEQAMRDYALGRPVLLFGCIEREKLCRRDPQAYLRAFHEFWARWGNQHHLMLICLFVTYPRPAKKTLQRVFEFVRGTSRSNSHFERQLQRLVPAASVPVAGAVLEPVALITASELHAWAKRLKQGSAVLDGRLFMRLEGDINTLCKQGLADNAQRHISFSELWPFWNTFLDKNSPGGTS